MKDKKKYLIVGAGFSGAVFAREIDEKKPTAHILVVDKRNHVAGNCYTERDESTGIMEHKYGPHIFHTSRKDVWDYVNQYAEMRPYVNRVKASIEKGVFSLPINLHTINQFYNKTFNPQSAREFIAKCGDQSIKEPKNFEEQALKFLGPDFYYAFFYGYTMKQWGCEPKCLPASILKRLPVRFNYDDNYYDSIYQGIPINGYTDLIQNILNHPRIEVKLGVDFTRDAIHEFDHTVYTGEIDRYFDYSHGKLGYRTVFWEKEIGYGDIQGNAVINFPDPKVKYTRVHEHKHFTPWESHDRSIILTEYSKETEQNDIPYYPKRMPDDLIVLKQYQELARKEKNVDFLGRLATYRYLDMHQIIGEAIDFSKSHLSLHK
jgi:UDP-galactopyranose mutase